LGNSVGSSEKKEKRRRRSPANGPNRFEPIGPDVSKRSDRPKRMPRSEGTSLERR